MKAYKNFKSTFFKKFFLRKKLKLKHIIFYRNIDFYKKIFKWFPFLVKNRLMFYNFGKNILLEIELISCFSFLYFINLYNFLWKCLWFCYIS